MELRRYLMAVGTALLRALRLPFGLPFGREHFVVYTDLERFFYLPYLLDLREAFVWHTDVHRLGKIKLICENL